MIKGNGIDVIEVERIKKNIENLVFLKKIYTEKELEYIKLRKFNPQTAAGIFAAKEAVSKSLGTGFSTFGPLDIEISKNEMGKPMVTLSNNALGIAKDNKITNIQLSITHIKDYAIASCIAEGDK
ncbi:phosphopantetheine--protein transferase-like protein [Sedimentibacter acidaminivorans]|uniref:Holo-[acyl-carrier-protein] synthase n=1 Tax=Sedimentibacter acidaminivorans TaxID=913099 RepID=A0ABS4GHT8_9FIRM|nr:holo-ACP synthase [Sedimentibacter acidaminivorans]MBP1927266.1 phosphopantetheine--protein transferase-like protein [Sedimentibacter acidaminivorans]